MSKALQALMQSRDGSPRVGHAHFWQRAMSRGQFSETAAGATGAALTSGLWMPALARRQAVACRAEPDPRRYHTAVPHRAHTPLSSSIYRPNRGS